MKFLILLLIFSMHFILHSEETSNYSGGLFYQYQIWDTDLKTYEQNEYAYSSAQIDEYNKDYIFQTTQHLIGVNFKYRLFEEFYVGLAGGIALIKNNTIFESEASDSIDHIFVYDDPGYFFSLNFDYSLKLTDKIKTTIGPSLFFGKSGNMHSIDVDYDLNSTFDEVNSSFWGWRVDVTALYDFGVFIPYLGMEINDYFETTNFNGYVKDDFGFTDWFDRELELQQSPSLAVKSGVIIMISKDKQFVIEASYGRSMYVSTKININL